MRSSPPCRFCKQKLLKDDPESQLFLFTVNLKEKRRHKSIIFITIILQDGVSRINAPTKVWLFKRITALFIHYTVTEPSSVCAETAKNPKGFWIDNSNWGLELGIRRYRSFLLHLLQIDTYWWNMVDTFRVLGLITYTQTCTIRKIPMVYTNVSKRATVYW